MLRVTFSILHYTTTKRIVSDYKRVETVFDEEYNVEVIPISIPDCGDLHVVVLGESLKPLTHLDDMEIGRKYSYRYLEDGIEELTPEQIDSKGWIKRIQ